MAEKVESGDLVKQKEKMSWADELEKAEELSSNNSSLPTQNPSTEVDIGALSLDDANKRQELTEGKEAVVSSLPAESGDLVKQKEKMSWADELEEAEEASNNNSNLPTQNPSTEVDIRAVLLDDENKRQELTEGKEAVVSSLPAVSECQYDADGLPLPEERKKDIEDPDDSSISTVTGDAIYSSASTFEDLNISRELLRGLYTEMLFKRPSRIQAVSLPMILTSPYKNLVAQAHNGSGKTTCFVLGMLSRVDPKRKAPQALCICPTRELAIQNQAVLLKMGKYTGITSFCAVPQEHDSTPVVKCPAITDQIVIGTPGTVKKWMNHKKLSTRDMKILVFDEADQMLDEEGFRDDSLRIMKDIKKNSPGCQVLLFSATFNDVVKDFVSRVIPDANHMFVKKEELALDTIKQYNVHCPDELAKDEVVQDKIFELGDKWAQAIIFVERRRDADRLYEKLVKDGYSCTSIHGATQLEERDKKIEEFRNGLTKVLISTNLLSRGFDQSQVNLVVNYNLPVKYRSPFEPEYEVYLHRIGRTGRFGRKGAVFNLLCTDADYVVMEKIERHFGHKADVVPDWKSNEDFEAALKIAKLL